MIQRSGDVVIQMLANVKQATIDPLIKATIAPGTLIYTDEHSIYARLIDWGYEHKTVCQAQRRVRPRARMGMVSMKYTSLALEGNWRVVAFLVEAASRHFSRKTTTLFRLF